MIILGITFVVLLAIGLPVAFTVLCESAGSGTDRCTENGQQYPVLFPAGSSVLCISRKPDERNGYYLPPDQVL